MSRRAFASAVWAYYKKHGRHNLPWRTTRDPYKVLVSEMMLQQTQVERVIPYYLAFVKKFPTVKKLASAPLAEVLLAWQGLGYNSRAKRLHSAAQQIVAGYKGVVPQDAAVLESLPGIGPYTAHAVAAFAYDHDSVFIETNIRTAVLKHFFHGREQVTDDDILRVLKRTLPRGNAREWYSALMDYGAYLKRTGVRTNACVRGYTKQSKFSGSLREARGAILRALAAGAQTETTLVKLLTNERRVQLASALSTLASEGLIEKRGKLFSLPR